MTEDLLLRFVDAVETGFVVQAPDSRIVRWNAAAERILGLSRDELGGVTSFDPRWRAVDEWGLPLPGDAHPAMRALATGEPVGPVVMGIHRPDGSFVWIWVQAYPLRAADGTLDGVGATFVDVTDARRRNLALEQSVVRLEAIIQQASDAIVTLDGAFRVILFNAAAEQLFGWTAAEMLGQPLDRLLPAASRDAHRQLMRGFAAEGTSIRPMGRAVTVTGVAKDGRQFPIDVTLTRSARPTGEIEVAAIIRDASEQRQIEAQLKQHQKFEAIALLGGGIAHDFNNLLTAIRASAEFLKDEHPDAGTHARQDVEAILEAVRRAQGLTGQLLSFCATTVEADVGVEVDAALERAVPLVRQLLPTAIVLDVAFEAAGAAARVAPGQLDVILTNLVTNARDAIAGGGLIRISTDVVQLDGTSVAAAGVREPGAYVRLVVTDSGSGMSADAQRRLFEPFFTTKAQGMGTGLGLATVFGIARQSGGSVRCTTAGGRGTTMEVFLPVHTHRRRTPAATALVADGRPRRVLVVDDEAVVRRVAARAFGRAGWTAYEAASGLEALDFLEGAHGGIDVIVSDLMMPGMLGTELLDQAHRRWPHVGRVLMSGYTREQVTAEWLDRTGTRFVAKPFDVGTLLGAAAAAH